MINNKIFFTRASLPPIDEYMEEIRECWDTRWITSMGPKHTSFENQLAAYLGVKYAKLFANGHSALETMLQASNLNGEVITTPFTFASTTHALLRCGLTPRFCDIRIDNYTIDADKIECLINRNTVAILGVHVFGNLCEVEKIQDIAKKYGIKILYDGAHSFGVLKNGKSAGTFGDATMYSFHASKVFNTIEGGAVVWNSNDEDFDRRLNEIRVFGARTDEFIEQIGFNGKMNEFEAAMGICNLRHFPEELHLRKIADTQYRERLGGLVGLRLNSIPADVESNYSYFPVYVDETVLGHTRDELCDALHRQNVFARKHFYQLANTYPCYPRSFANDETPIAEKTSHRIMSLPLYAGITEEDINRICDIIYSTLAV